MRSVRTGFWLAAFLLGASIPAFCQIVVPPNGSGRTISSDTLTSRFEQFVHSTGAFDFTLAVFRNGQLKYSASGTVNTSGPTIKLIADIPVNRFGLVAGDTIIFALIVRHRVTEGGTTSTVLSLIPVVAPACPPPTTTAPTTRHARPPAAGEAVVARREEREALI